MTGRDEDPMAPVTYGEPYRVTAALERAARKLPNTATPYPDAYGVLDAGLNAEEIAATIWASDYEETEPSKFWGETAEIRNEYLHNARAIRAMILGRP